MKLDLSANLLNEKFEVVSTHTLFSFVRDMLGKHEAGANDKVFDILYAMKEAEKEESFIIDLTFSEVDFIMNQLIDSNKTHFAFYKEFLKREIKKQKDAMKEERDEKEGKKSKK